VKLTNNLVQHQRTKHIDVRHHFIRDHQQKSDIAIENVGTEHQLANLKASRPRELVLAIDDNVLLP
jgi:hypothetical protein